MLPKIFITAVNAVFPLVLLIMLGYFLKRHHVVSDEFVRYGNKLNFTLLLPSTLLYNIYNIPNFASINWPAAIFCVVGICILFLIGLGFSVIATPIPARRGVIAQCSFRSNYAALGLSLANALGGDDTMAIAAVVSAFTIPLFNILSVISLSVFCQDPNSGKSSMKNTCMKILRNPMIISSAIGLLILLLRELQVQLFGSVVFTFKSNVTFLYKALENVKSITAPFALLILGADFEFKALRGVLKEVIWGTSFRLVFAPTLALVTAFLLSTYTPLIAFGRNEYATLISLFGSPVAVASVVMAEQMDGDSALATQLVVWTSVFSILTIFLQVCILMAVGLL